MVDYKNKLTNDQYQVCRLGGTEAPFSGKYYDHFESGVYSCVCCDAKLFDSETKFQSHCGWPSFNESITGALLYKDDFSHNMKRTEIQCSRCHSHLGHVFDDGPKPSGKRYCVNSVSLIFHN